MIGIVVQVYIVGVLLVNVYVPILRVFPPYGDGAFLVFPGFTI